jgi:hypothetical protein
MGEFRSFRFREMARKGHRQGQHCCESINIEVQSDIDQIIGPWFDSKKCRILAYWDSIIYNGIQCGRSSNPIEMMVNQDNGNLRRINQIHIIHTFLPRILTRKKKAEKIISKTSLINNLYDIRDSSKNGIARISKYGHK